MIDDRILSRGVLAELARDPSVTGTDLGVTSKDGIVTVTGHVTSFAQKHAVNAPAHRVNGVKAIGEEISVKLPFEHRRSDEDIAAADVNRLDWDAAILPETITAQVRDDWVSLDWNSQKDAAALDVRSLLGVVGLSNRITIRPPMTSPRGSRAHSGARGSSIPSASGSTSMATASG